ncbi:hypothetical protein ACTXPA_17690 [Glutamicibacter arilaitensis]|uniref:hypothetical protein n=1 Tax=Glutamicibacter arilaitensis TaxID=256701 RepID=UPI003FD13D4D
MTIADKATLATLTAVAFMSAQLNSAVTRSERGSNDTSNFGWIWIAVIVVGAAVAFMSGKAQEWMDKINSAGWW